MQAYLRGYISFIAIPILFLFVGIWYFTHPLITEAENSISSYSDTAKTVVQPILTNSIIVHLDTNTIELRNGTTTTTMTIVSQGKPGSYYETIAGLFTSDYKEENHFSSMGHVYMPFSVHLFGNYFIHGIPYYPDGTKVSSTFSGGCIRLNDTDAKHVYDFVTASTTIIITRSTSDAFIPTALSSSTLHSIVMTRLMTAFISLEFLKQDNEITNNNTGSSSPRIVFLPYLLTDTNHDVSFIYRDSTDDEKFVQAMNARAQSLGLTNTVFTSVNTPATTTEEDYGRFMSHILLYKSYLNKVISH